MALVNYSDSEGSDAEVQSVPAPALAPPPKTTAKPNFHKVIDRSEPRKIKIDLPTIQPESSQRNDEERPAKKARTVGAFSGFNSLLPAPKRGTATNGPKPGVSLKTSSEAAFSRASVVAADMGGEQDKGVSGGASDEVVGEADAGLGVADEKAEAKIVGKATRFKPLSVTNRKKPVKKTKPMEGIDADTDGSAAEPSLAHISKQVDEPAPPPPTPKRSLFSVPQDEQVPSESITDTYESMTQHNELPEEPIDSTKHLSQSPRAHSSPNSLQSLASGLNLTRAQRRQLFGRNSNQIQNPNMNIAHFNMDAEYASNERLRQAGEVVEHRAVKAIAPGKHSLQQLVNNARSQQDAMEDKWADGRREKGEGGAKYGWGK